jgi:hypothetical protein
MFKNLVSSRTVPTFSIWQPPPTPIISEIYSLPIPTVYWLTQSVKDLSSVSGPHGSYAPPIVNNAHLQKVKDLNHLLFIEEQRDDKIRQECFSSTFSTLMPGMTLIPLWVVPKPHSDKWHLVADHSAGNYLPNSLSLLTMLVST